MLIEKINKQDKCFAALLDPDKADITTIQKSSILPDLFFVGGSFVSNHKQDELCRGLKNTSNTPVVLFPGDPTHISNHADAILFLSLISGRNAEFLIGKHVIAAPMLKRSTLKILPTGYMLIDAGKPTSASYISHSLPLPYDKIDLAVASALAAEMLGMKYIFLDTGSGAQKPVSLEMIHAVSEQVSLPVIVGGGISNPDEMDLMFKAGANVVVVGTHLEKQPETIHEFIGVSTIYKS